MINYKQIVTIKGPAAEAIQKALNEERALTLKYAIEGVELVIILGAETKGNESVNKEELVEEGEELLFALK